MIGVLAPGILASYVQGCPIELSNAMAGGLSGLPLQVSTQEQTFGAAVALADVGNLFYAGSRRWFNTGNPAWSTPRVMQCQLLQLDAGVAAFRIESATHTLEASFDSASGTWAGSVDGVAANTIGTGFYDDVVTFRISGTVAEVRINDEMLATSPDLFADQQVRLLLSWDTLGASDGSAITGQVFGGLFAGAITYLEAGDGDWCGERLNIFTLQDQAPGDFTASSSLDFIELRALTETVDVGVLQETAPGEFSAASSLDLIEARTVTEVLEPATLQETAPGTFSASASLSFIELRQVTE